MDIKAEKRTITGKKLGKLRKQGLVPGAISRYKKQTILIALDEKTANKLRSLKQVEKHKLTVDGQTYTVVVSEIYADPLNNRIMHINFTEITPNSHVIVEVPIRVKGISPAVKNNIGVMLRNLSSIRLVFNSNNIVPFLEIDVSGLENVGDRILFTQDLLPEGVKPASFKDFGQTIVTIRPPQKAVKVETTEEGAEVEEGQEATEEGAETPAESEAESSTEG